MSGTAVANTILAELIAIEAVATNVNAPVEWVHQCCTALGLIPKTNPNDGVLSLNQREMEIVLRARTLENQGNSLMAIQKAFKKAQAQKHAMAIGQKQGATRPEGLLSGLSNSDMAILTEAMDGIRVGMLKDVSRLLEEKLSGLDDVVVELIRTKSENDTLRGQLRQALDEKEELRYELSKFKPVGLGLYRKS